MTRGDPSCEAPGVTSRPPWRRTRDPPLTTLTQLAEAMQALLTTKADELARSCGFVRRQRKVTGANFAQAVVFTAMADAEATESRLHSTAAAVGLDASRQALEKRFNAKGAAFLRALLRTAV